MVNNDFGTGGESPVFYQRSGAKVEKTLRLANRKCKVITAFSHTRQVSISSRYISYIIRAWPQCPHFYTLINNHNRCAMKKILVPLDFSENAENALYVAASIARKSGATLELLHVNVTALYSAPASEYALMPNYAVDDHEYDETAGGQLEKIKEELLGNAEFADLNVRVRVEEGFLHKVIGNVATDEGIDLVVMGTRGASGLNEFLVGSNTEKVIRTAPCPVLAVPVRAEHFNPKTVMLSSTLKPDQAGVFRYLAQWANLYHFVTKVLYLNNPANLPTDGSAEAFKNRLAEAAGLGKTDVIITGESFFEDTTIIGYADQLSADLIVMATHQRQGLSHVLFGSITEDTVNHSDIPVLSVPVKWRNE